MMLHYSVTLYFVLGSSTQRHCSKLLVQYKAAFKQVQNDEFPNVENFMKKYTYR